MPESAMSQFRDLKIKYDSALQRLIPVARAAANQMKDAGMSSCSEAISSVLFEVDAVQDSMLALMKNERFVEEFIESLKGAH